jgi:hypothetical protein
MPSFTATVCKQIVVFYPETLELKFENCFGTSDFKSEHKTTENIIYGEAHQHIKCMDFTPVAYIPCILHIL